MSDGTERPAETRVVVRERESSTHGEGVMVANNHGHSCGHTHYGHRAAWLRAAVLGANDALVTTSSLMLGVGAVEENNDFMVVSGLAGLVAGACSMGIGEYVSVHSQRDTEKADLEKERLEHEKGPEARARELEELAQIYVKRGLKYDLAKQVAEELTSYDYLRAHARDELGIDMDDLANPFQAAAASVLAFILAGLIPLLSCAFVENHNTRLGVVIVVTTVCLFVSGVTGAWLGGASIWRPAIRVTVGGWAAMLITFGILRAFSSVSI